MVSVAFPHVCMPSGGSFCLPPRSFLFASPRILLFVFVLPPSFPSSLTSSFCRLPPPLWTPRPLGVAFRRVCSLPFSFFLSSCLLFHCVLSGNYHVQINILSPGVFPSMFFVSVRRFLRLLRFLFVATSFFLSSSVSSFIAQAFRSSL